MKRSVVELDLVGYSTICDNFEQGLGIQLDVAISRRRTRADAARRTALRPVEYGAKNQSATLGIQSAVKPAHCKSIDFIFTRHL